MFDVDISIAEGRIIEKSVKVMEEINGGLLLDRKEMKKFEFSNEWQREYFLLGHLDSVDGYLKDSYNRMKVTLTAQRS